MKKIFLLITIIFIAFLSYPIFAQEDPGADPEAPAAPIYNYLWVLGAIGLIYVFSRIRALAKQSKIES